MTSEEGYAQFGKWYQNCIDNGLVPEMIVAKYGLRLLTHDDEIDYVEKKFGEYI